MIMVLLWMKYGCMGIGFMQQHTVILMVVKGLLKGYHQTTLHDESLPNLKAL